MDNNSYSCMYDEEDNLCVLISPGWGAGWSTWDTYKDRDGAIAYDERVIKKWMEGVTKEEMYAFLESIGYDHVYMGGYNDLILERIPRGTKFYIDEYDGYESIKTLNDFTFMTA